MNYALRAELCDFASAPNSGCPGITLLCGDTNLICVSAVSISHK